MATLPALTKNYFSRVNTPFGTNNTSQQIIESYWAWGLYACLTDQITIGSANGTRDANSIWFVRGSSNATTGGPITSPGVAGTDLWGGGTFPGVLTRGNNFTPHYWVLLENTFLDRELLINMSQTDGYKVVSMAPIGTFAGGTNSAAPSASVTTIPVQLNQTSYSTNDNGQYNFFRSTTDTGNTDYLHFTCADDGEFWFGMSRASAGTIFNWIALWKSTGNQTGDNNNFFLLSSDPNNARGGLNVNRIASNGFCASITPNNSQKSNGGLAYRAAGGANATAANGTDAISAKYISVPCEIFDVSPQYVYRGILPDIYQIGDATIGSSIPNSSAQQRIVAGNLIIPCTGSAILL